MNIRGFHEFDQAMQDAGQRALESLNEGLSDHELREVDEGLQRELFGIDAPRCGASSAPGDELGGHPLDVWVDVTCLGSSAPEVMLAVDGREAELLRLRELYVHDRLGVAELEQRIEEVLHE